MTSRRPFKIRRPLLAIPIATLFLAFIFSVSSIIREAHAESEQDRFEILLAQIKKTFLSDFQKMGKKLVVAPDWENSSLTAGVGAKGDEIIQIDVSGGLYRLKGMTDDAFTVAICHEIGHRLGGSPVKWDGPTVSVEGQADYYSTLRCTRRVWANEDSAALVKNAKTQLPEDIQEKCKTRYALEKDQAICKRSILGAFVLHKSMKDEEISAEPELTFGPHELTPVEETLLNWWPAYQCRLDTMIAGALCNATGELSLVDPKAGTCLDDDALGSRPRCWYNPKRFTRTFQTVSHSSTTRQIPRPWTSPVLDSDPNDPTSDLSGSNPDRSPHL